MQYLERETNVNSIGGFHSYDEIVEFLQSGCLFRPSRYPVLSGVRFITDFGEAKTEAWDKFDSRGYSWKDIRELEIARVFKRGYEISGFVEYEEQSFTFYDVVYDTVLPQLGEKYKDAINDVASDLYNSALDTAVNGNLGVFFGRLFEIYRVGCWPCGWSGQYPEGRGQGDFLAFLPPISP